MFRDIKTRIYFHSYLFLFYIEWLFYLKQSELRQREQKIRKGKDELKIRERIIEESQNERKWFKTCINKLEQRVKEIERSNEILCKQSTMFNNNTANSNAQQNTPNQSPTTSYESTQMKKNLYTTCQNQLSPSDHHNTVNILMTRALTGYQFYNDHNF